MTPPPPDSSESREHPRVLVVNHQAIGSPSPVGITLASLFRGWPSDRIAQVYADPSAPDTGVCARNWLLRPDDRRVPVLLRRTLEALGPRDERPGTRAPGTPSNGSRRPAVRLANRLTLEVLRYAGYRIRPAFADWVRAFRPQAIYSILEHPHITRLVRELGEMQGVPTVPHIMDDWLGGGANTAIRDPILRSRVVADGLRILASSKVRMAIGPSMAQEYGKRYGGVFVPFMNCVDLDRYEEVRRQPGGPGPTRIVFAGGLRSGRMPLVREVARAVADLNAAGRSAELHIYAPVDGSRGGPVGAWPHVHFHPVPVPEAMPDVLSSADLLLVLESLEPSYRRYLMYSISGRLPDYLAAGKPILAVGPRDNGTIAFLCEHSCAMVAESASRGAILASIRLLLDDQEHAAQLGRACVELAASAFAAPDVRKRFRMTIAAAARQSDQRADDARLTTRR